LREGRKGEKKKAFAGLRSFFTGEWGGKKKKKGEEAAPPVFAARR